MDWSQKGCVLPQILSLVPEHEHYIEPFFCDPQLFFSKSFSRTETLNDTKGTLVNFYRVLQNERAFRLLREQLERAHKDAAWRGQLLAYAEEKQRSGQEELGYDVSEACSIFLRSAMDETGACDTAWQELETLRTHYADRLKQVQILSRDAGQILRQLDYEKAFFYLEPTCETDEEHEGLLESLAGLQGKFLLCSSPSKLLARYARTKDWQVQKVVLSGRRNWWRLRKKTVCLASNYVLSP